MRSLRRSTGTASLLLLLVAALTFAAVARAAEAPPSHPFLFTLQGEIKEPGHVPVPPPEGQFEDACGVAVDSEGDIYVSDYYHRTIDIYRVSEEGGPEYLTQIADPDPDGPCNLAVDSSGDVYVNNWHRDVVRFTPSEFPPTEATRYGSETTIDFPSSPGARSTGVAIDPATGRIYVDDRTYVAVYEPSGTLIDKVGEGALGAGYGIAVSDFTTTAGDIYVPDAGSNTLRVFGPSGESLAAIDGAGTPQHGFVSLYDSNVAVNQTNGHLFVADNTEPGFESPAAVVDEFNPAHAYRGQLPKPLIDAEPTALAVDAGGNVYVTNGNTEGASLEGFGPTISAHSLKVSRTGSGEGAVTSEPAGIDCGTACAAEYNAGSEVTLLAVPAPGSAFAGWTGGVCTTARFCHITLSADSEVSAEFEALPPQPLALVAGTADLGATGTVQKTSPTSHLAVAKASVSGSTARLQATVPSSGILSVSGNGLRPSAQPVSAGPAALRLRLNHRGRRALHRAKGHRLKLKATVTFKPNDGSAASVLSKTLTFKANGRNR